MLKNNTIQKLFTATIFTLVMSFGFAALTITGKVDRKSKASKYSLKNINFYANKSYSLSLYRTNLMYRGSLSISPTTINSNGFNSFMQIEKGNTTYIMPYKLKVKAPKFKTPSPNN
jgi:hypothetical protein